uniref:Uncharacterized protein n=1 Tax=Romanomermis culicivorax TaxID=13658 RepID=A0A915HFI3_ROMCU
MLDKVTIGQYLQKSTDDKQRRALFLHYMDDFVSQNLKVHLPFDEAAQRGKVVYSRLAQWFEETKIADVLINVPTTEIKHMTKVMENQKWLFHDDQREIEVYTDHEAWERYVDKHDQNSDRLIVGLITYINLHSLSTQAHLNGAGEAKTPLTVPRGSMAYAFLKLRFNQPHMFNQLPRNDFLDLVAYLKTALVDYFHERNEPQFLRLKAEQNDSYELLPDEIKKHVPLPPTE